MQGKYYESSFLAGMDIEKVEHIRKIYEWIQSHTDLCHLYTDCAELDEKNKLKERITVSLAYGKELLDDLFPVENVNRKPSIPLSGMNRFTNNSGDESIVLAKRDVLTNFGNFKAEVPTLSTVKKVPLPSRTYLKKK